MPSDNQALKSGPEAAEEIRRILGEAELFVATDYREGRIFITGKIDSPENRQAVLDVAHAIADPLGIPVSESLLLRPDFPEPVGDDLGADEYGSFEFLEGFEDDEMDLDPGFDAPVSTRITEDSETYFPPTDPVVRPSTGPEKLEIVGGFGATSMDPEPGTDDGVYPGDEALTEIVKRELLEDALTIDLDLEVSTVNGVVTLRGQVPSQQDADNAASVAGRIDWVREVQDEMTVRPRGE